ncbi:Uncharacterised protein [Mycobacteroides abscessus subsp. abscessus]|uniref:hypothetical protein n=1 Tax=Mycobacteroides abscessus TaxID=36809 RepID=UPI00092B421C|nr:hypothetical protein [Mycobacteroides abscessus]MDO3083713.1 hypothetical protein [Mycobacteroides abscessus subsp. abscessus]SHP45174.1 Uncharacterised protein [Mycobacteroides abscessus subsp. abscessus]SHV77430.1 Uncharacterised protein [Mycobacteroides abscessus subsp. abscessus]SHY53715.1 Uncharacterised protein [Mycobacteroides abscessus subsp. abscessus]SHZ44280.1 Uncharacterised protein [Mycobacteroides abscessus subsp. abscessus]
MKWPRKPADWLINYIADRFYDRLRDRLLEDLAPWAGKGLRGAHISLSDFLGRPQ